MTSSISICTWNVNGIRAMMGKVDMDDMIAKYAPDIICMQEIKSTDVEAESAIKLTIKAMYPHRVFNHSKTKKGYSGTGVISKHPIKEISIPSCIDNSEGRVQVVQVFSNTPTKSIVIVNVYTMNSGQKLERAEERKVWDANFKQGVAQLMEEYKDRVIVCGDLNVAMHEIDVFSPKSCKKYAGFQEYERQGITTLLNDTNLVDTYRYFYPDQKQAYTYWSYRTGRRHTDNRGWRIDYILSSSKLIKRVTNIVICTDVLGSDHTCVIATITK